jgi:hypothetical protein
VRLSPSNIFSVTGTNTLLVSDLDYEPCGRTFHNSGVTSGSAREARSLRLRDYLFD